MDNRTSPLLSAQPQLCFLTTKRDSKTSKCGHKIGRGAINVIVGTAVSNATNKYCTPQLIRSAIVEFFKDKDASDETLESLAWLMAHSREMQNKVYDKRTSDKKAQRAQNSIEDFANSYPSL